MQYRKLYTWQKLLYEYTGYTQKNGAVSKVKKKFISHLNTGTTYTVSNGNCPSFSCATSSSLLMLTAGPRSQFPRWRRSRKRLSVCSVLRCPDLWLQCSVSSVHGLEKTHMCVPCIYVCVCVCVYSIVWQTPLFLCGQCNKICVFYHFRLRPYTNIKMHVAVLRLIIGHIAHLQQECHNSKSVIF